MKIVARAVALAVLFSCPSSAFAEKIVTPVHAFAMHGKPKYGPGFKHFDYVNPHAPKGGDVRLHGLFQRLDLLLQLPDLGADKLPIRRHLI